MFEQAERADLESLMQGNTEFRQLYHKHKELDDKVRDAELGVLPMDVVTLHNLKNVSTRIPLHPAVSCTRRHTSTAAPSVAESDAPTPHPW